ncbi:hypothetical protein ROLI_044250 [Roseobacter fucihabitans]|uniref:Tetrapyrrole biosynthesis uroporphyrinogen III synthase domain-containing protein n=2 Tax=Roseobacter fucihabitans TaxID=1537242 RepID=A0ABZ2C3E6_9RHOB|nr:uroporphyrinogen-III synthase [Roseobacter litoralis]MBC6964011.1 uroporphyrinogen-III synthase [Roseobacter litoralis]
MVAAPIPLIITRPEGAGAAFVQALPPDLRSRFHVMYNPLIEIVSVEGTPLVGEHDAVIFTSANGVRFAPDGQGRVAYCVGAATTKAAGQNGWRSRCLGQTADALIAELIAIRPAHRLWHLSGIHARGDVVQRLSDAGIEAVREPLYDQRTLSLSPEIKRVLDGAGPVVVPLFSPRTAAQFARECPENASPLLLALSAAVAHPLAVLKRASVDIAANPSAPAMQAGLEKLITRVSLG